MWRKLLDICHEMTYNYNVTSTEWRVLLVEGFWGELKLADWDRVHSAQRNSDDLLTLEVYEIIFAHQQRPVTNQQLIQNRIPDTNVLNNSQWWFTFLPLSYKYQSLFFIVPEINSVIKYKEHMNLSEQTSVKFCCIAV